MSKEAFKGCEVLFTKCGFVKEGEKVLIITDDDLLEVGRTMYEYCRTRADATLVCTPKRATHGSDPTAAVAAAMAASDVIFSATTFSLYNTPARLDACKGGARFVNMADYSMDMLTKGCLFVDFDASRKLVEDTAAKITGDSCTLTTPAGTNLSANITGRKAVSGFGQSPDKGMASSPPNIETAVGPTDGSSQGTLVIDGSIPLPGLGVIREPITVTVKDGLIIEIAGGAEADLLRKSLADIGDDRVYVVGEIGLGMNTAASLSGRMLEDEGVFGTMHIGIGNNLSYGGTNAIGVHIDMVMKSPTYTVDGRVVLKDGKLM